MTNALLALELVRLDGDTQARTSINQTTVDEYAEVLMAGDKLPPVAVMFDGAAYWMVDGFHRLHAHRQAGLPEIECSVTTGTQREAMLRAAGANANHGLRRTVADKRKAVRMLLEDAEWGTWGDREIARACNVSHPFVGKVRAELNPPEPTGNVTSRPPRSDVLRRESNVVGGSTEHPAKAAAKAPGPVESGNVTTPPDLDTDPGDVLEDMRRDLDRAEAQAKELQGLLEADAAKAPMASLTKRLHHAERRQGELMEDAANAKKRAEFYERQLARCGKAVGVKDLDKVAPAVEAMARKVRVPA